MTTRKAMTVMTRATRHLPRFCLLVALLLGSRVTVAAGQNPPEPVKLKLVFLPFLSHAPFFIAQEEGYFAEQGLEMELVRLPRMVEAIPSLARGDLDVVAGATDVALLNAIARGAGIKLVAGRGYVSPDGCVYDALMPRKALAESGELDRTDGLRGKRFSLIKTAFTGYMLDLALEQKGLTIDDVEIVTLRDVMKGEALASGSIDVAGTGEPWITRIVESGQGTIWMTGRQLIPGLTFGAVLYGPSILERNPDAGRRFMVAYLKAVRQYNQGKTERNLEIVAKHTGLDRDLLERTCWPAFRNDGLINVRSILGFQEWALKRKFLDTPVTEEQFWEPAFVKHAVGVLGASAP